MKFNFEKLMPAAAVGLGLGALFFYLYKEKKVFSFHGFEGLGSGSHGECGCSKGKEKKEEDDDKKDDEEGIIKKLIKEDKHNKDMKYGPSGYRRTHHKRGTIRVGNKRREVEIDDGFDPTELDYERTFGNPEISQFSHGGLSI